MSAGRYAPSPSGELHLGNLRTAILAWLFARSTDRNFYLRVEDLDPDRSSRDAAQQQLADLQTIGLDWDAAPLWQSERDEAYRQAFKQLRDQDYVYECFCTRKDIQQAVTAPHTIPGQYPGTCRELSAQERAQRRRNQPAAWRLRSAVTSYRIHDQLHGDYTGPVDDFVLLRNDGTVAYNLAVVIDDASQGIDQVVRGDDLLSSTPRQAYLAELLEYSQLEYAHVPLAVNSAGRRLAKRDGAVTPSQLVPSMGVSGVRQKILESLDLPEDLNQALRVFHPEQLPRDPWVISD